MKKKKQTRLEKIEVNDHIAIMNKPHAYIWKSPGKFRLICEPMTLLQLKSFLKKLGKLLEEVE